MRQLWFLYIHVKEFHFYKAKLFRYKFPYCQQYQCFSNIIYFFHLPRFTANHPVKILSALRCQSRSTHLASSGENWARKQCRSLVGFIRSPMISRKPVHGDHPTLCFHPIVLNWNPDRGDDETTRRTLVLLWRQGAWSLYIYPWIGIAPWIDRELNRFSFRAVLRTSTIPYNATYRLLILHTGVVSLITVTGCVRGRDPAGYLNPGYSSNTRILVVWRREITHSESPTGDFWGVPFEAILMKGPIDSQDF